MYLLLVFLSIIGSCLAGLFGRYVGSWGAAFITTGCLFLSFLISLFAFYEVAFLGCCVYIKLSTWISSETLNVDWGFMFDSLTVVMCVIVTFISFLVHLYSTEYMSHDPHLARFMSYLSLFTFFMLMLVTADNFVQMFVGWEGVGLCSYLLINFWFTRIQANKAAIKAMLLNRIGDFSLLIGIFLILVKFKAIDYATVAVLTPFFKTAVVNFLNLHVNLLTLIGVFLFIGAVGKSAQIGLHTWLPDAMEGFKIGALFKFHCMREHLKIIWSTQKTFLFGKIQIIRQSAGNQTLFFNNKVGSSETIRETLSDINLLNLDSGFKYWFIGFIEGDGSFIICKNGYLEFKVTQSSVDAQILFYIKKKLGFGSVSRQSKKNQTHHFRVRDQKSLFKLIYIFNGNLLTYKKNNQFKLWVEAYNKVYNSKIYPVQKKINPTLDNAWLSGFSDSEGCFTVSIIKRSQTYNQVQVRYILSQKNEFELMNSIAKILNGKIFYFKSYGGYNMTVNLSKLSKTIKYFTKYPLKTKKYIDYLNWLKAYKLVINKKHMTQNGLIQIKKLLNKINKRS